eukprot:scaffold7296_cov100-Isochrysis_galbana.AAC.4
MSTTFTLARLTDAAPSRKPRVLAPSVALAAGRTRPDSAAAAPAPVPSRLADAVPPPEPPVPAPSLM